MARKTKAAAVVAEAQTPEVTPVESKVEFAVEGSKVVDLSDMAEKTEQVEPTGTEVVPVEPEAEKVEEKEAVVPEDACEAFGNADAMDEFCAQCGVDFPETHALCLQRTAEMKSYTKKASGGKKEKKAGKLVQIGSGRKIGRGTGSTIDNIFDAIELGLSFEDVIGYVRGDYIDKHGDKAHDEKWLRGRVRAQYRWALERMAEAKVKASEEKVEKEEEVITA
jgi:hypothetical protein